MNISRLAAVLLLSAAGAGFSLAAEAYDPVISIAGQHRTVHPSGGTVEILAADEQTDGEFSVLTLFDPPGGGPGNGVTHADRAEIFYVLEGTYRFYVADQTVEGGPGTFIINPPGVPHGFNNIGATDGRLIAFYTPGGFEDFFIEWAESGIQPGPDLGALEAKFNVSRPPQ
jgi:mannose-6-phosphate isomerase-like protein (cupin superfamily)